LEIDRDADGALSRPSAAAAFTLQPVRFADLEGFAADDHLAAFRCFRIQAAAWRDRRELRVAIAASDSLRAVFGAALAAKIADAPTGRDFFTTHFVPHRIVPADGARGFVTGYYEPIVDGSLTQTAQFTTPLLARPDNLDWPYPDRAAIEDGAIAFHAKPLAWVADPIEAFMIHVQGSTRVHLPGGSELRLVYAGRNGHPYTSVGHLLIARGEIEPDDMSLASLKAWVRAHGQNPGQPGGALLRENKSYIFFAIAPELPPDAGPIGGAGVPLSPLRSIAVDRTLWSYGLPFWLDGKLAWETENATPFRRLMIAADTGTAIVGPARADIFFGSGEAAGARAGVIRQPSDFTVLLPRGLHERNAPDLAAAFG
jgi:membrane-bound lytic murein transglycosylase A